MSDDEKHILLMESQIPSLSGGAFAEARRQALASGLSVLQSEGGVIYEVFPDGTRREFKRIEKPIPVQKGARLQLR